MKKKYADIAERVLWTAAQAGIGAINVAVFDLPPAYAVLIAAVLSAVKGFIATKVGTTGTAATLPASLDPAA